MGVAQTAVSPVALAEDFPAEVVSPVVEAVEAEAVPFKKGDKRMGLRLIYGKSGSGKSEFCFREMKEKLNQLSKIYMITPEQFSYMQERKLLDVLEQNAVIQAEVLTFARMAHRILKEERGACEKRTFEIGKSNAYFSFITKTKKEFNLS